MTENELLDVAQLLQQDFDVPLEWSVKTYCQQTSDNA